MTSDVPKAREMIREGLADIKTGEAKIKDAVDNYMYKGRGEEPKAPKDSNSSSKESGERVYVTHSDISPMFDFVLPLVPDSTEDKRILRSIYGDWRAYKRLSERQYYRLRKEYLAYDGPELILNL